MPEEQAEKANSAKPCSEKSGTQQQGSNNSDEKATRHNKRMAKQKQLVDEKIAAASEERGVVVLLTGNGKGKSSSAFGMLARALGHGQRCAVVQFIKGQTECGENLFFKDHPKVDFYLMKTGFTWESQNYAADKEAAESVWQQAQPLLSNPDYDLIIFDEITYMFKFKYLDQAQVMQAIAARPKEQSIVLTGRGANQELMSICDTISVVELEKHAFNQGIKARIGIEW